MKRVLFVTVIIFFSLTSFAQARFGFRGGVNFVDLTNLESEKSTKTYLGVFLAIEASKSYSLRPEITYSRQGSTLLHAEEEFALNDDYSAHLIKGNSKDINIDFINISLINQIKTSANIIFLVGPFVGIRISDNLNDEYFFNDLFPRLDIGLAGGLAYDISKDISIELKYKRGFTDLIHEENLRRDSNLPKIVQSSNHSETFQIGVSYKLSLKK